MDRVERDLVRLSLILECEIGQESFSTSTRLKDFTSYYFTRFLSNFKNAFKDFSSSEIIDYNNRHSRKLQQFGHQTQFADDSIVPIPKAMVGSYKETLDSLVGVLHALHSETLYSDLDHLLEVKSSLTNYSQQDFNQAKDRVGHLFAAAGPSHSTVNHVLRSPKELLSCNASLMTLTKDYYPQVISLNKRLVQIEDQYHKTTWSDAEREQVAQQCMTMAYRLSIFATVMRHVQELEHTFVKALDIVLSKV